MQTLQFPKHMEQAFDKSIDAFAQDGFLYDLLGKKTSDDEQTITVVINCTVQEAFNLGIKVGYRLKN